VSQATFRIDLSHQLFCNSDDAAESISGVLDEQIELLAWSKFQTVF
jgi:hypothetical protein